VRYETLKSHPETNGVQTPGAFNLHLLPLARVLVAVFSIADGIVLVHVHALVDLRASSNSPLVPGIYFRTTAPPASKRRCRNAGTNEVELNDRDGRWTEGFSSCREGQVLSLSPRVMDAPSILPRRHLVPLLSLAMFPQPVSNGSWRRRPFQELLDV